MIMKNVLKMIRAGVLVSALCVGFVACNEPKDQDPKEEGTEIQHVPTDEISAEVIEFFRENNQRLFAACLREGIFSSGLDVCAMINSVDELPESDPFGAFEYPAIDFDSYTLVLGAFGMGNAGELHLAGQSVVVGQEKIIMHLRLEESSGNHSAIPWTEPFWGLYPKLPDLPITVER